MPSIVQIIGTAPNSRYITTVPGAERWCSNAVRSYGLNCSSAQTTWTRWFNFHSKAHILKTYPESWELWKTADKPIYLQQTDPDIPMSLRFPREEIQNYFGGPQKGSPGRYFTCSVCWLLAFAIMQEYNKIELWGFILRDKPHKPHNCYKFERPCFFYWVQQARDRGIEVTYPKEVHQIPFEPGDPTTYTESLYGYCTTEPHHGCDCHLVK